MITKDIRSLRKYDIIRLLMNNISYTYCTLFTLCLLLLSSCEKVVKIDLNNSDPHLVVEVNITNQAGPYTVKLSRSVNYYDTNTFPATIDASVTISDNAGNSEVLHQTSDGMYQTSTIQGVPGRTYMLKIIYNGKEYDATSIMPNPVPIDSVVIVKNTNGGFGGFGNGNSGYRVITFFKDPGGLGNYYRLQMSSNDTNAIDQTRYRLLSDKLTDGVEMSLSSRTNLLSGDSVTVKLESIDKSTYDFYYLGSCYW